MFHPAASYRGLPSSQVGGRVAGWGGGVGERLCHFFMIRELESMLHFMGSSEPRALVSKIRGSTKWSPSLLESH